MKIYLSAALASAFLFCCIGSIMAQDVMPLANVNTGFAEALQQAFGSNKFTARIEVTMNLRGSTQFTHVNIIESGKVIRTESRVSEFAPRSLPEQKRQFIASLDTDEVVSIYHGDNNTCIFLFPKMKASFKTQAPPSMKNLFDTMATNQVGRISLGVETLRGITCRKSSLNYDCPHPTTIATVWENEKSGAPVALEVGRTNQIVHLQILSYSAGPQPLSQFEIPPGYTDYLTYTDILQEARKRLVHASVH